MSEPVKPPSGCTTREELAIQHDAEKARVEAKIASMSKPKLGMKPIPSASVQLQAAAMREELRIKHENDIRQLEEYLAAAPPPSTTAAGTASSATSDAIPPAESDDDDVDKSDDDAKPGPKLTKAQRRREKKKAAADSAIGVGATASSIDFLREEELKALDKQLVPLGLTIKAVASDGNCMFRAVQHQIDNIDARLHMDYTSLRKLVADYIRTHAESFAPFLHYLPEDGFPDFGEGPQAIAAVNRYCDRFASTATWGGHPELRALANAVKLPIVVYQANADPWVFAPDDMDITLKKPVDLEPCIKLSYHKHYYVLGEHYNSLVRNFK